MNDQNKLRAIVLGILILILMLMISVLIMPSIAIHNTLNTENDIKQNATQTVVEPEPEFNVELTCPEYRNTVAMSKYEDVPGACFEYFHITDAMMEARIRAMYPYDNPCSN